MWIASLERVFKPGGKLAALSVPNFSRFVLGQSVSLIGSWTETVAQAILVLQLSNSATSVGFVTAARYLPVLLITANHTICWSCCGSVQQETHSHSDGAFPRYPVYGSRGLRALKQHKHLARISACAFIRDSFRIRQSGASSLHPRDGQSEAVRSAVTINSSFVNVGRAIGPMVAAGLIATLGLGWCFLINAASFGAVQIALATMTLSELHPTRPTKTENGQLVEGLRYALKVPEIIGPIAMMALIGTRTYEFEVSLPLFARVSLDRPLLTYNWLIGAFGVGSVAGGFYAMWRPAIGLHRLTRISILYAAAMLATAFAPNLTFAISSLLVVGFASIPFLTTDNSTIQLVAAPQFRGRVMALWSTAFLGSTPIGASIMASSTRRVRAWPWAWERRLASQEPALEPSSRDVARTPSRSPAKRSSESLVDLGRVRNASSASRPGRHPPHQTQAMRRP